MADKKKRWRPSLTAYRELEGKLTDAEEELMDVKLENATLRQSNALMEQELKSRGCRIESLENVLKVRDGEIVRLRKRGFWRRLFNYV